jgi:dTDP-4-amino-4,6-dideoxygalactose transaminase
MTAAATRSVPLMTLAPGVAAIRGEIDAAIARVLDRGLFLDGPETRAFEDEFAAFHRPGLSAVGVGTGTDALRIGLQALGVEPGDEVLMPANAGVPPVAAVVGAGARPIFCDVALASHAIDPDEVARRVTSRTRALLVVHLYGQPAPMPELVVLARQHRLRVLEDCAQAHGARVADRLVGTFGDAAAFSFYPTKNIGALGDAGIVLSGDPSVVERARLLRSYGWRSKYISELHSGVSRLDELQAAILRVKLGHLAAWNHTRQALAARYRRALGDLAEITLPSVRACDEHVYHLFVVRSAQREALRAFLTERAISTDVHYPVPAHLQTPYAHFGEGPGSLPRTEQLAREILSLPLYPELPPEDLDVVADQVRAFVNQGRGS